MPFTRWNRSAVLRRLIVGALVVGLTMGGTIWAQPMSEPNPQGPDARRPGDQGPDAKQPDDRQKDTRGPGNQENMALKGGTPYPAIGGFHNDIPDGYDVVRIGPEEYIFYEGVFYTRDPRGFKVVTPPKGAVIRRLPVGFETLIIADTTYFIFADVYYTRATGGYLVADPPANAAVLQGMAVDERGKSLTVDAELLNVRSGPGVEHPVVSQLHMGDTVTIQGTSGEWYYVELPDGSYGWVLSKFTRPMAPEAKG